MSYKQEMAKAVLEKALNAHLQGQLISAKKLYLQAINEGTRDPAAHANLGYILKGEGRLEEALLETKKALSLAPNSTLFLTNAGGILLELCDYKECIKYSLRALEQEPKNPMALSNLACAYKETGYTEKALEIALMSLHMQPENAITLTSIGYIFMTQNNINKALEAALNAIQLDPKLSSAYTLKGKALAAKGETTQAIEAFTQALTLNENSGEALLGLSMDIKTQDQATRLIELANKADPARASKADQTSIYYSYANCFHKLKDYKNSEFYLRKAHKIKGEFMPSDADWHCERIQHFKTKFYSDSQVDNSEDHPRIFIVGMPRCGSTLLETTLSANSSIQDLGETKALGLAIDERENQREKLISLDKIYTKLLNIEYKKSTKYTVDKQLYNFQLVGFICAEMPCARVVHCRRNPLDNILSMLRTQLTTGNNFTIDPADCAKVLIQQELMMNQFKQKWAKQIYTFSYDEFISRPETTLKPLIEWLDLKWSNDYLHPERSNRTINTASVIQARQPINRSSLGGWKNYKSLLEPAIDLIKNCGFFNDFGLD